MASTNLSIAFAFSIPVLAATLSFVTYTSTSHSFDVAVIFSSFSLFQVTIVYSHLTSPRRLI